VENKAFSHCPGADTLGQKQLPVPFSLQETNINPISTPLSDLENTQ